ncbi:MAG: ATP-binding protein [Prevotella sp.]|nr:ATP-binding protein [Prevotella sp.]
MANALKRLPTGIQTFSEIIEGGYLYVDKTALIYQLTHNHKYVFLSRPRRFGKSTLCSTLKSYFEGRRDLFQGLAMEHLETEWRQHPVLLISLATIKGGTTADFNDRIKIQLRMFEEQYGITKTDDTPGGRLENLVKQLPAKTGEKCVVIIDEYDAPLLTVLHNPERLAEMRQTVRAFFSCLKDCDPWLRFTFITGITKFSQVSIFSELNNLDKITMAPQYSTLCGITQEELQTQMIPWVEHLATDNNLSVEDTLKRLKVKYDGYHFAKDLKDVYNPYSLLQAFMWSEMKDYWFDTGTPSSLLNMLEKFGADVTNFDNGCLCEAHEFDAPTEKMTTPMPFFYQSGYLTIKDYDPDMDTYTLRYPNREVRNGMISALIPYYLEQNTIHAKNIVSDVYRAMRRNDLDEALQVLKVYLASVPYAENATSEGHYQTMLYVVFSLLGRYVQMEVRTARGRIDMVLQTATDLYVMELKIDRPAAEALQQIDQKGYLLPFEQRGLRLHKVGISFSTEERTLSEWQIVNT